MLQKILRYRFLLYISFILWKGIEISQVTGIVVPFLIFLAVLNIVILVALTETVAFLSRFLSRRLAGSRFYVAASYLFIIIIILASIIFGVFEGVFDERPNSPINQLNTLVNSYKNSLSKESVSIIAIKEEPIFSSGGRKYDGLKLTITIRANKNGTFTFRNPILYGVEKIESSFRNFDTIPLANYQKETLVLSKRDVKDISYNLAILSDSDLVIKDLRLEWKVDYHTFLGNAEIYLTRSYQLKGEYGLDDFNKAYRDESRTFLIRTIEDCSLNLQEYSVQRRLCIKDLGGRLDLKMCRESDISCLLDVGLFDSSAYDRVFDLCIKEYINTDCITKLATISQKRDYCEKIPRNWFGKYEGCLRCVDTKCKYSY